MQELQRYRPLMFAIARRMVGDREEAEDLTQEACLRYCATSRSDVRALKPFLTTIVRRLCLNHLNARRRRERPGRDVSLHREAGDFDGRAHPPVARLLELGEAAVQILLESLTPPERAVYVLHDLFFWEHDELASLLALNEAGCWQLLHRAREHIARRQVRFQHAPEAHRRLTGPLLDACLGRDLEPLVRLLVHDCRLAALPLPPEPLIGRAEVLERVCQQLERAEVRLMTLTGPPGVGKTHLALGVAAALIERLEHGVYFVALADVQDPAHVAGAIARRVGARSAEASSGDGLLEQIGSHLRERELLLVLDNFEHLLEAAPIVSSLLGAAPGLRILITSRERLRLPGEDSLQVLPLPVPASRSAYRPELLAANPAVRLFVSRAAAVRDDFTLTDANAPAVAALCARLDGLPLALELAASRIRAFSPEQLLARLDPHLSVLRAGASRPARHRTLRDTLAWSYALLEPDERLLFALLGVFVGGCTLEALTALAGNLAGLGGSLVEKSLVQQQTGAAGTPRFTMLETVRAYAHEQLEQTGRLDAARAGHARYFLELATQARAASVKAGQETWLQRLDDDVANLRTALAWALEARELELAARLGGALWWFWYYRGHTLEGIRWLEAALDVGDALPLAVRADVLQGLAVLSGRVAPVTRVRALYEECLRLGRAAGDWLGVARTLTNLVLIERDTGMYDRAATLLEEALQLWRSLGHEEGVTHALAYMALVARDVGDLERAARVAEEGVAVARRSGTPAHLAATLALRGNILTLTRNYEGARAALGEALTLNRRIGHDEGIGLCVYGLGLLALEQGDTARAAVLLRRALRLRQRLADPLAIVDTLEALAIIAARAGRHDTTARLMAVGAAHRQAHRKPVPPADRARDEALVHEAREALGEEAFKTEWEQGLELTLEEASALVSARGNTLSA